MKKILFVIALIGMTFTAKSQDVDTTITSSHVFYFKDTLTTTIDTVDVEFNWAVLGTNTYTIVAKSSAADTLTVWTRSMDGTIWSQVGMMDLSSGSYVASIVASTTGKEFEILDPQPNKIRVISTSNDGSTCIVIYQAKYEQ